MSKASQGGLVYSTQTGRMCPDCREAVAQCRCHEPKLPAGDGTVKVSRDSKGRGGKVVTLVSGVPLLGEELKNLAKELKQKCGVGGAIKDGVIEIQGEQRELIAAELIKKGFKVKKI